MLPTRDWEWFSNEEDSSFGATRSLFGSVTDKDIAAAIKVAAGTDIDRHSIKTAGHIKKTGTHALKVSLAHAVVASVNVSVVAAK